MSASPSATAPARRVYPFEPYYDHQSSARFNLLSWPPRLEWTNDRRLLLATLTPDREITLDSVYEVETIWEHPRCPFVVLFTSWAVYVVSREHFDAADDHRDSAAPAESAPADQATSIVDAWRALPQETQARVGARMAEHARHTMPDSDRAHRGAERAQVAGTSGTPEPLAEGTGREALAAFATVGALLADIERRADDSNTKEAHRWADMFVAISEYATITVDDVRYAGGDYWVGRQTPGAQGIGFVLWLRAFADHPDALAQWATYVADRLEQGLLTDEPLPNI